MDYDNYIKLGKIGDGSCGNSVYLVKDLRSGTLYAMKRIIRDSKDQEQIQKNEVEIENMKTLNHQYLIKLRGYFIHKNKLCIIMEYADDGDLYNKIKNCKAKGIYLPEDKIWKWFLQICSGLHYLHSKKIIHRDIKSQNVFMTKAGDAKLGDFGISKSLKNTMELAITSLGTPYFLSPEICKGKYYNFKTDVWMLGCVLYEMITLEKPFNGDNLPMLMENIQTKDYKPIPEMFDRHLADIIRMCLDKDMNNRPSLSEILSIDYVKQKIKTENIFVCTTTDKLINTNNNNVHIFSVPTIIGDKSQSEENFGFHKGKKDSNTFEDDFCSAETLKDDGYGSSTAGMHPHTLIQNSCSSSSIEKTNSYKHSVLTQSTESEGSNYVMQSKTNPQTIVNHAEHSTSSNGPIIHKGKTASLQPIQGQIKEELILNKGSSKGSKFSSYLSRGPGALGIRRIKKEEFAFDEEVSPDS